MTSIRKYYRSQFKWYIISTTFIIVFIAVIFYYFLLQDFFIFYQYLGEEILLTSQRKAMDKAGDRLIEFILLSIALIALCALIVRAIVHKPLYCPNHNCYKTVLPKSILPFRCPFCDSENNKFSSLYTHCENSSCKSIIPAIPCPHCGSQIDLLGEYDIKKIKEKRYGKKTKV